MQLLFGLHGEVDSRANNSREEFLGFDLEYLNIVSQIECSHEQPEKFVCLVQQWFSNCASRRPGASFQFSKGVTGYFGFVPISRFYCVKRTLIVDSIFTFF